MNEKIGERHLCRKAILYVRQSTVQQLANNEESRRLQYAMGDRLRSLGWKQVEVVDEDLGRSAAGVVERSGFERMVAQVSLGEVGAVCGRELSRLARNSRDWQKLIEVCRYVDTLLVDQDTVYDARLGNDRLLLGLKGTLNEYELDLLRLRAHEARQAKARRGEFLAKVAVGYRKSEDGELEKTPDLRVQKVIGLIFEKFFELGSARQCLLWFREHQLEVPINRNHRGQVLWKSASYHRFHQILTNPVYAGAYAYGRTAVEVVLRDDAPRTTMRRRPRERWPILLRDHHEAYIEWERFERIQEMLSKNAQRRTPIDPGAAKRGRALLAGVLRCRRCGQKLVVSYSGANHDVHRYVCERRHMGWGEVRCLSFSAKDVDACLAQAVLQVVRPAAVEASLGASREQTRARDEVIATLALELKAAQYAADRASRQYEATDPENRLVVDELERRWNAALERVGEIEERMRVEQERIRAMGQPPAADALGALARELPRVWSDPATDVRLKKRIVRVLVEEVVVDVTDKPAEIVLVVHWKGGVHTELRVPRRRRGYNAAQTPPDVVEAVRALAMVCRDEDIARWLNRAGIATARDNRWTRALVAAFRSKRGIPAHSSELQDREGWVTLEKAAALAGVASLTLKRAVRRGVLGARQPLPLGPWLFRREDLLRPEIRERLRKRDDLSLRGPAAHASRQLTLDISST